MRTSPSPSTQPRKTWWHKKTAAERREKHIVKGTVSLFTGVGLTIFLYYFTGALVLKLPPDLIMQVPFEIEPVVRILWLLGLVPMLSGAGHILAGLLINTSDKLDSGTQIHTSNPPTLPGRPATSATPASITENTTNLLDPIASSREKH